MHESHRRILSHAYNGGRVVQNGKTIWGGLGNRSGLHDYADTVMNNKWKKSGPNFQKKVLGSSGDFELHSFRNVTRDRGKWNKIGTVHVPKSAVGKKSGQDVAVLGTTSGRMGGHAGRGRY